MKIRVALAILLVLAFTITTAYAATIRVSNANYVNLGWKKTLKTGAETGQAVSFDQRSTTVPPYVQEIVCSPKKSATNLLSWAGLSLQCFEGKFLSDVTVFKIPPTDSRVTALPGSRRASTWA